MECQTDTKYACQCCGNFNGNDIFGSRIFFFIFSGVFQQSCQHNHGSLVRQKHIKMFHILSKTSISHEAVFSNDPMKIFDLESLGQFGWLSNFAEILCL